LLPANIKIAIKKECKRNILMSKPATPGKRERTYGDLQSHVDMVCEKNNGNEHDYVTSRCETIVEDGEVFPNGSALWRVKRYWSLL
jgi:dipeptidase D